MPVATFRFYEELNDFLPRLHRKRDFGYRFPLEFTVKHVIEALGVPHTEVEVVLVDGESVGFEHRLPDGARVSVYPRFETLDVEPLLRLRPRVLRTPAFLGDGHLGGLVRLLRLLGFDAAARAGGTGAETVRQAVAQGRILLTRSRALLMHREVTHGCFVRSREPPTQAAEVVDRLMLRGLARPFTRCLECNAPLEVVTEGEEALARIPPRVRRTFDDYRRCPDCGRMYWKGSHYRRLERLAGEILADRPA